MGFYKKGDSFTLICILFELILKKIINLNIFFW